jgi:Ca2+-binding RTX toxin-like protein
MVQPYTQSAQTQPASDIVLSPASVSETAFENDPVATLSTNGGAAAYAYAILSDSSGGAFRIEGDRLVVADNDKLDFETAPEVTVTIRATGSDGQSHTETITIAVTDEAVERRYSTRDEFMATETDDEWDYGSMVVPLAGGGFALIWHRVVDFSTNDHAIMARYFDADGAPASDEIVLVSGEYTNHVSATPTAEGGFLLSHTTESDPATGISSIRAQAYDDAGNPVAPAILFTPPGGGPQYTVAVQLGTGGYVISWIGPSNEIHAQRFTSAGAPTGPDIFVGTGFGIEPSGLTATADGGFAVAWVTAGNTGNDPWQVKARFFDSSGAPDGPPIAVAAEGLPESATLVTLADGSYVLGWADLTGRSEHGSFIELKALPIGADGLAAGPPVVLATYKAEAQFGPVPSFAAHPDGGFVAMWPNAERGWNDTVYHRFTGRQFDSSGAPIGPEFQPTDFADGGDMAVLADGTIATAWYHSESFGQGVSARVYRQADSADPPDSPWGTPGNDVIYGTGGADWVNGRGGDDQLYGLGGDDELLGRTGNDFLSGGAGDDLLRGGDGDDVLDGGAGDDDWLRGGAGNDLYIVDSAGDRIFENADSGTDEIRTALASYSLAALPDVENLTAASNGAHDFRGNWGNNVITGGGGADLLRLHDGGDDRAMGGEGNDVLYFGTALNACDVADGGAGRDAIVLQGNVTAVLSDTSLVGIESISIQSGANAAFDDTANNFYDYNVTTADGNVAAGQQLIVNAQSLRAGEDFTFDGSAESDGKFLVYGGHGVDDLTGGAGADVFLFEGTRWGPNDKVDGGAGRDALVISAGSGLTHIAFAADALTGIESISLNNRYATDPSQKPSYELVLHNGNVAPGGTLIVNGSSIPAGQVVNVDGRAVQGGSLNLLGGAGHDILTGGKGGDLIVGGGGADALTGGAGADTFRYDAVSDSRAGLHDLIGDFQTGVDKIDLSRIDANTHASGNQAFTWIGANAFSGTGAASAGQLRVVQSSGQQRIEGDTNGDGLADLVIVLQVGTAPVAQADFLL